MPKPTVVAIVALMLVCSAGFGATIEGVVVNGHVRDVGSFGGLANARVVLVDESGSVVTETMTEGSNWHPPFRFDDIAPGRYTVYAEQNQAGRFEPRWLGDVGHFNEASYVEIDSHDQTVQVEIILRAIYRFRVAIPQTPMPGLGLTVLNSGTVDEVVEIESRFCDGRLLESHSIHIPASAVVVLSDEPENLGCWALLESRSPHVRVFLRSADRLPKFVEQPIGADILGDTYVAPWGSELPSGSTTLSVMNHEEEPLTLCVFGKDSAGNTVGGYCNHQIPPLGTLDLALSERFNEQQRSDLAYLHVSPSTESAVRYFSPPFVSRFSADQHLVDVLQATSTKYFSPDFNPNPPGRTMYPPSRLSSNSAARRTNLIAINPWNMMATATVSTYTSGNAEPVSETRVNLDGGASVVVPLEMEQYSEGVRVIETEGEIVLAVFENPSSEVGDPVTMIPLAHGDLRSQWVIPIPPGIDITGSTIEVTNPSDRSVQVKIGNPGVVPRFRLIQAALQSHSRTSIDMEPMLGGNHADLSGSHITVSATWPVPRPVLIGRDEVSRNDRRVIAETHGEGLEFAVSVPADLLPAGEFVTLNYDALGWAEVPMRQLSATTWAATAADLYFGPDGPVWFSAGLTRNSFLPLVPVGIAWPWSALVSIDDTTVAPTIQMSVESWLDYPDPDDIPRTQTDDFIAEPPDGTPRDGFQAGIVLLDNFLPSWERAFANTLQAARFRMAANWVEYYISPTITSLVPLPVVERLEYPYGGDTPDDVIESLVERARRDGFRVRLNIMPWPLIGWGEIPPDVGVDAVWVETYFDQLTPAALDIARTAESLDVDMIAIQGYAWGASTPPGSESFIQLDRSLEEMIISIREVYNGSIALSGVIAGLDLNAYSQADFIWQQVSSWDYLWGLSDDSASVDEMAAAMGEGLDFDLLPLAEKYDLPVLISAMFGSYEGAVSGNPDWETAMFDTEWALDLQVQVDLYEAMGRAISERPWIQGLYTFFYSYADSIDETLSVRGKPSEPVLGKWLRWYRGVDPPPPDSRLPAGRTGAGSSTP